MLTARNTHLNHPLISLINLCKSMRQLKQIHAQILTFGLSQDEPFAFKLQSFSAISDSGDINYSYQLFLQLPNPNICNWNTLIRGFSKTRNPNRALSLYIQMLRSGFSPDHLTFPFLAKSCSRLSSLSLSASIHCHIAKSGIEFDIFVQNSLVHMYSACGAIHSARRVFDGILQPNLVSWNAMLDSYAKCGDMALVRETFDLMQERDVVSWSALIAGYVKDGNHAEAILVFERMQTTDSKANEVTMVSVLCACAHLGALDQGKKMHRYIDKNRLQLTLALRTSLVDMYAKCGSIEEALRVFRNAPLLQTDVLIWNTMIGGLATHGFCMESLYLFEQMQSLGIVPDEITYLGLLSECAHGGLVDDAWYFFKSLNAYGMIPKTEHYACMVDVLGRAGQLDEAYKFIKAMPIDPTPSMLGALLSGCKNHGRVELGETVGKWLIEIEPDHDGRYIGLSNVYAIANRWDEAKTMREAMEKRGVKKFPGCSCVEVDVVLHRFIAHDITHPQSTEIYAILKHIEKQMKLEGDGQTQTQYFDLFDIWTNWASGD